MRLQLANSQSQLQGSSIHLELIDSPVELLFSISIILASHKCFESNDFSRAKTLHVCIFTGHSQREHRRH